ncbi:MAG: hypothetical protein AB4040_19890 [Synechococcus sp.]
MRHSESGLPDRNLLRIRNYRQSVYLGCSDILTPSRLMGTNYYCLLRLPPAGWYSWDLLLQVVAIISFWYWDAIPYFASIALLRDRNFSFV